MNDKDCVSGSMNSLKVRYRSSCDACTEAKVRCNKKHPQCERCNRTQKSCNYRLSKRTRRLALPASAPSSWAQSRTVQNSSTLDEMVIDSDISFAPKVLDTAPVSSTSVLSPKTTNLAGGENLDLGLDTGFSQLFSLFPTSPFIQTSEWIHSMSQDSNFSFNGSECCVDKPVPTANDPTLLRNDSVLTDTSLFHSQEPSFFSDNVFQSVLAEDRIDEGSSLDGGSHVTDQIAKAPNLTSIQQQQGPTQKVKHSCLLTAKRLQQSILDLSFGSALAKRESTGASRVPTADEALLTCSSISKDLIELLQCRCEADDYLPFLVSVIISKIFAAYGAIARVDDSTSFPFASNTHLQMAQQNGSAFLRVPLQLGTFEMDKELEGVLRTRLVLHELSKVECLVVLFMKKYCHSEAGSDVIDVENEKLSIYTALGQFIKHRFARTVAACEAKGSLT